MSTGGLFYHKIDKAPSASLGLTLLSDLHFGSAFTDYELIREECHAAHQRGDRILLNGDVVDGIFPGDKRYSPEAVHKRIRGRRDGINAVRDWVVEFFSPYATSIDLIGLGNHETTLERKSYDIVRDIVAQLSKVGARSIAYGGYTGVVEYRLLEKGKRRTTPYVLFYHHGSGKGSSVRSSMESITRKASWATADLYWQGHSHCRFNSTETVVGVTPAGSVATREVRYVVTGAYYRPYEVQSQESFKKYGRKALYPSDAGLQPHGLGGCRVVVTVHKGKVQARVTQ